MCRCVKTMISVEGEGGDPPVVMLTGSLSLSDSPETLLLPALHCVCIESLMVVVGSDRTPAVPPPPWEGQGEGGGGGGGSRVT